MTTNKVISGYAFENADGQPVDPQPPETSGFFSSFYSRAKNAVGNVARTASTTVSRTIAVTTDKLANSEVTTTIKARIEREKSIIENETRKQEEEASKKRALAASVSRPAWESFKCHDEKIAQQLKANILQIPHSKRNLTNCPSEAIDEDNTFSFDMEALLPCAIESLKQDKQLAKIRFEVVPRVINEDDFWRNYFYRIHLLKRAYGLIDQGQDEPKKPEGEVDDNVAAKPESKEVNEETDLKKQEIQSADEVSNKPVETQEPKESPKEQETSEEHNMAFASDLIGDDFDVDKEVDNWKQDFKDELDQLGMTEQDLTEDNDMIVDDFTWEDDDVLDSLDDV